MIATSAATILTEVFPIRVDSLPSVSAYRLDIGGGDFSTIGGKLSYRLKREFQGHWVWTGNRLITDHPQDNTRIMNVVEVLWSEQQEVFKDLRGINQDMNWQPHAQAQADFVARGLVADNDLEISGVLATRNRDLGSARVERVHRTRGWVVDGRPALSISVFSRLFHNQDLITYASQFKVDPIIKTARGLN